MRRSNWVLAGSIVLITFFVGAVMQYHLVTITNNRESPPSPYVGTNYNLPPEEAMVWALGENYGALVIWEIDDVWNERHGDLFQVSGTEFPREALERMYGAYLVTKGVDDG